MDEGVRNPGLPLKDPEQIERELGAPSFLEKSNPCAFSWPKLRKGKQATSPKLLFLLPQGQRHHQHHQLCNQRLCWLRHLLYPRLHGQSPGCGCVSGGRPRARASFCSLPRGSHTASHLPTLVLAVFLHAHLAGTRYSGMVCVRIGVWWGGYVAGSLGRRNWDRAQAYILIAVAVVLPPRDPSHCHCG